jgi:threonine dehydrogenase-like Zn-dependent dehydrogenase
MRALLFDSSLRFDARYPEPGEEWGDTLIRVRRAGICSTDLEIVKGYMGYKGVLGHEFVGTVVSSARKDLVNQRVVGEINVVCARCDLCMSGLSLHCRNRTVMGILNRPGCFADHLRLPAENLHVVPKGVDEESAVFTEPLAAACAIGRQVRVDAKTWVTVLGDGRLGLLCAQVLRNMGAPVRVVGRNPSKLALCEKWQIRSRLLDDIVPRHDQDVVVDCTGSAEGLETAIAMCRPRGTLVLKSTVAGGKPLNLAPVVIDEISVVGSRCGPFREALQLLEAKAVDVASLVSRRVKFENALEAMELAGRKGMLKVMMVME